MGEANNYAATGEAIKAAIYKNDGSVGKFVRRTGIQHKTIAKAFERRPSPATQATIEKALGWEMRTIEKMASGEETEPPRPWHYREWSNEQLLSELLKRMRPREEQANPREDQDQP